MENQPKISTVEAFILISGAGLIDATGIALLLFGLDDLFLLDIVGATSQLYFRMKGVSKAGLDLVTTAGEMIPYLGALPLKTAGILMVIWADRHPEGVIAQAAEKAAAKVPIKRGKGGVAPARGGATAQSAGIRTPVGGLQQSPAATQPAMAKPTLTKTEFKQEAA